MNEERPFTSASVYQIRVKGHLDDGWSDWLEDLTLKREVGGMTLLVASVPDQPALYGLIIKIRDLEVIGYGQCGRDSGRIVIRNSDTRAVRYSI